MRYLQDIYDMKIFVTSVGYSHIASIAIVICDK